ncbi:MAG: hypothetical protein NDI60_00685 [Elusimicrobiales bacterium]|nr:hypothetical protein [Elusimicrobiales bacterium]
MIKIFFSLILITAGQAYAFDLPQMDAAAVRTVEFAAPAPEAKGLGQNVWLSVTNNASFREARASDWNNRIEAEVRGNFPDRFDVNLRADYANTWGTISKSGSSYNFFGSGMNLYMSGSNGHYFVNGSFFENGKNYTVSVNISGADAFSGNAYGSGLNLFISRGSINGWFEAERLPKKAVAAVTAFILALQLQDAPAK